MVAKRWLPYKWQGNNTNDTALEFLNKQSEEDQKSFREVLTKRYEAQRQEDVARIRRSFGRAVGRVRLDESKEEQKQRRKKSNLRQAKSEEELEEGAEGGNESDNSNQEDTWSLE